MIESLLMRGYCARLDRVWKHRDSAGTRVNVNEAWCGTVCLLQNNCPRLAGGVVGIVVR